nr:MAG TPA: hypothetical protein [Caudoviricetes sp.]
MLSKVAKIKRAYRINQAIPFYNVLIGFILIAITKNAVTPPKANILAFIHAPTINNSSFMHSLTNLINVLTSITRLSILLKCSSNR